MVPPSRGLLLLRDDVVEAEAKADRPAWWLLGPANARQLPPSSAPLAVVRPNPDHIPETPAKLAFEAGRPGSRPVFAAIVPAIYQL